MSFVSVVTSSSLPLVCDKEWTRYKSKCYRIHDIYASFAEAVDICGRGYRGKLATITSQEEQNFLGNYTYDIHHRVWIGGMRTSLVDYQDAFYWIGGQKMNYTDWIDGEPNNLNKDENCIAMGNVKSFHGFYKHWLDERCDSRLPVLCQKDLNTTNEDTRVGILLSGEIERTYKRLSEIIKEIFNQLKMLQILRIISALIIVFIIIVYWSGKYKHVFIHQ